MADEDVFYRNLREAAPIFLRFADLSDAERGSEYIIAARELGDIPEAIQPSKGRRMDVKELQRHGFFCEKRQHRMKAYYLMATTPAHLQTSWTPADALQNIAMPPVIESDSRASRQRQQYTPEEQIRSRKRTRSASQSRSSEMTKKQLARALSYNNTRKAELKDRCDSEAAARDDLKYRLQEEKDKRLTERQNHHAFRAQAREKENVLYDQLRDAKRALREANAKNKSDARRAAKEVKQLRKEQQDILSQNHTTIQELKQATVHLANAAESSAEVAKLSEAALKRARNVHNKQMKRKDRELERYKGRTSKIANDIQDALSMEFSPSHERKEPNNLERMNALRYAAQWGWQKGGPSDLAEAAIKRASVEAGFAGPFTDFNRPTRLTPTP